MGKLNDPEIRGWVRNGERFEGRGDGDGLYLRYRKEDATPRWLFRYRFDGKPRVLNLGSYTTLSLADARKTAKEMRARVTLGHDVAMEKKDRKREASAKIEAEKSIVTVAQLADEYFEARILGRWKHPNIVRSRIERDIKPNIGKLALADVKPSHIDAMLKAIVARGAPTMATDVLRWTKRMFDYAMKREMVLVNVAAVFDPSDAGGKENARDRWLTRAELGQLLNVMKTAKGWTHLNTLTVKLLLMLAVRKSELIAARIDEFNLDEGVWYLPGERTKTGQSIDIPLPRQAVEILDELIALAGASGWLLPARKMETRMIPHIDLNTINAALAKCIRPLMPNCEAFTPHDFRRTARTHLEALGVAPHVAERCLNHKIKGVEGIYNRHDYFEERKAGLQAWADLLTDLEAEGEKKVIPIRSRKRATA
ncbi:MAG TPA: tyrosine-type recombinase/integrase [Rhodocyclaceae bacterium]|nr:tyrosine-type recombinase/integrase [Thiobacillaceae bacterium]HNE44231.1 tyrosine-type recombinase/integrase [Rhodocyclaceae bacterium]HNG04556.1 tyrosine-type recombinase/integrase [Nitrospira sp.]